MSDPTVGYGKPPEQHRFKAGSSGNPKGRPKGARGFKADLADAFSATIAVKENGSSRKITVVAAALKRLIQKAVVDGNLRAIERLLALAQHTEAAAPPQEVRLSADDRAVVEAFLKRQAGSEGDE
jgi:hypothetical protein